MSLSFNINKVICISLKSHNEQQLKAISETYLLSFESLLELKNKDVIKIWVETGGDWVIAAIDKAYPDDIYICEKYCPMTKKEYKSITKIKPIKTPKLSKKLKSQSALNENKSQVIVNSSTKTKLTVDSILDKINLSGLDSLTKEELNFLKNFK